jgi:hypothetical protein
MLSRLRRAAPQFLLILLLLALGFAARRFERAAPAGSTPDATLKAAAPTQPTGRVLKIGAGKFADPIALAAVDNGELIALDGGSTPALRRFTFDGRELQTLSLPPAMKGENAPQILAAAPGGTAFVARRFAREIWKFGEQPSGAPEKIKTSFNVASLAARGDFLFVLGSGQAGIERIALDGATKTTQKIALSSFPAVGNFSDLRIGENGDFYLYDFSAALVWRFDGDGKLIEKIGGGGAPPPQTNLPGDFTSPFYDIAPDGAVFWTLGDYGALLKIDPQTKIATQFRGRDGDKHWTGNYASLTGFALGQKHAFILDKSFKRITAIPLSRVSPGAPDTRQTDTRAFGLNFKLESDAPYKIFTTPKIALRAAFEGGRRTLQNPTLKLTVRDFEGKIVAQIGSTPDFKGAAAQKMNLPVFELPRLGWYEVEAALHAPDSEKPLFRRVHFVTRTPADPALPIPDREYSGWEDLRTHRMVGMGLHRFSLHRAEDISKVENEIKFALKEKIPHEILIINQSDCTPEKLKTVLDALKKYGANAPLLELVNEPDLQMSASAYVEILRRGHAVVKQQMPNAKILGPVQCGVNLGWLESFLSSGGGDFVDAISLHTYERHNAMDAYHWQWKFEKVRALLQKYRVQNKPLFQTEHGFLGDYGGYFARPQWQANQLTLEKLVLDRFDISDARYMYYYVNESGYKDYNAYIVNRERELFPAAAMTRIRRRFLGEKTFVRTLEFPAPGDWLLTGNLYRGAQNDLIILQNNGALAPIELSAKLPKNARVFDCWGNALSVQNQLSVGRSPLYVLLARNADFQFQLPARGKNIAPLAKISTNDSKGQSSAHRLTNGLLEFDFQDQPERVGFLASDNKLPLDVTLAWSTLRNIRSAILYASLADNDKSTPLDYDVLARQNGTWKKVDAVRQTPNSRAFDIGSTPRLTSYENPWIFRHDFGSETGHKAAGVVADALRFRFLKTTRGHFPTPELAQTVGMQIHQNFAPRVELREVQVY